VGGWRLGRAMLCGGATLDRARRVHRCSLSAVHQVQPAAFQDAVPHVSLRQNLEPPFPYTLLPAACPAGQRGADRCAGGAGAALCRRSSGRGGRHPARRLWRRRSGRRGRGAPPPAGVCGQHPHPFQPRAQRCQAVAGTWQAGRLWGERGERQQPAVPRAAVVQVAGAGGWGTAAGRASLALLATQFPSLLPCLTSPAALPLAAAPRHLLPAAGAHPAQGAGEDCGLCRHPHAGGGRLQHHPGVCRALHAGQGRGAAQQPGER
jgi:hypothetical protein